MLNFTDRSSPKVSDLKGKYDEAVFFEDKCSDLLIKAIYNEGNGFAIPSKFRIRDNQRPVFNEKAIIKQTSRPRAEELTPDFCVKLTGEIKTGSVFASCLKPLLMVEEPVVIKCSNLATPPPSPPSSVSGDSLCKHEKYILFEYTVDDKKWVDKMSQVEDYLEYILISHEHLDKVNISDIVVMAGLVFPSTRKFAAIRGELNQKKEPLRFPLIAELNSRGHFFFLVCDDTFVKGAASEISSNSQDIQGIRNVIMLIAEVLVGDIGVGGDSSEI